MQDKRKEDQPQAAEPMLVEKRSASQTLIHAAEVLGPYVGPTVAVGAGYMLQNHKENKEQQQQAPRVILPPEAKD
jgi:hypothetical protein